jgi:hypothetical protein
LPTTEAHPAPSNAVARYRLHPLTPPHRTVSHHLPTPCLAVSLWLPSRDGEDLVAGEAAGETYRSCHCMAAVRGHRPWGAHAVPRAWASWQVFPTGLGRHNEVVGQVAAHYCSMFFSNFQNFISESNSKKIR